MTMALVLLLVASLPPAADPRRETDTEEAAVSAKMLADTFGYRLRRDAALDATRLENRYEELVFVAGMRRFSVNGLVLELPFAPFHQGDRLYLPVGVINYINTPMPAPERLPPSIRQRVAPPEVGLRCVFLDPGHGGRDPGAIGPTGLEEKFVTLDIARRLRRLLEDVGVRVVMSRGEDRFVPLEERARLANRSGAEVFVSIHVNAAPSRRSVGVETYYLGYAGPPGSPARRAGTLERSLRLARCIQQALASALTVPDRGVKEKNLNVLRNCRLPAVLVEVGFLSNPSSERLLYRPSYRQRLAVLIARGIAAYSRRR